MVPPQGHDGVDAAVGARRELGRPCSGGVAAEHDVIETYDGLEASLSDRGQDLMNRKKLAYGAYQRRQGKSGR